MGDPRRQVSTTEGWRNGHLLDDASLGATLIKTAAEPLALVAANEHRAQDTDRHQARDGAQHEKGRSPFDVVADWSYSAFQQEKAAGSSIQKGRASRKTGRPAVGL